MTPSFPKTLDLDFAHFELYENYVISTINEGVAFNLPHLEKLYSIFELYYPKKPFVSIANRKYDYTIDPNLLSDRRFVNLLGIGVVCYSESSYQTALFEKQFYKGIYEIFPTMEECLHWSKKLLNQ